MLADLEARRIVRSLKSQEETQYEITHDILALVVGQNMTEEMKLREKALDVYRVYQDRQGLLSQDDLDHLRMYKAYRDYPQGLQQLVDKSSAEIEHHRQQELRKKQEELVKNQKELKKTQFRYRLTMGLFIVAVALAIFAGVQWDRANDEADRANKQTGIAKEQTRLAEEQEALAKERTEEAIAARNEATNNLIKAHEAEKLRYEKEAEIAKSNIKLFELYQADDDVKGLESAKLDSLKARIKRLEQDIESETKSLNP
jgi:hypothetical protein